MAVEFQAPDLPRVTLRAAESGLTRTLGPKTASSGQAAPVHGLTGPAAGLLAWLIGRGDGAGLSVQPPGPLPKVPAW